MFHFLLLIGLINLFIVEGKHATFASFAPRERRYLIVPPTAPTRHQFIAGIGIPVDLTRIAITSGYVFKAQYFLPTLGSDWRPSEDSWAHEWRKRRDLIALKMENYTVSKILIEETTNSPEEEDLSFLNEEDSYEEEKAGKEAEEAFWRSPPEDYGKNSRWNTYKGIEAIVSNSGYDGRSCVLRSICEAVQRPFSKESGLLAELFNIIFSPSSSNDKISHHTDYEYFYAEKQGKLGVSCEEIFKKCPVSILDVFTAVPDTLSEMIRKKLQ
ncbi:uncharacterized protein DMENIID0001_133400 [Sergentomyia squamirostris]